MNAPDAVAPRDPFRRDSQGPLRDAERPLLGLAVCEPVLKVELTDQTGGIPWGATAPSDSSGVVTLGQPSTGDCHAQRSRPQPVNMVTPPGKPQTVTGVADALAPASKPPPPPTFGPVRALGGP